MSNFNFEGMSVGDWFLGCPTCGNQLPKNTAAKPFCEECGERMNICTVEEEDMK